MAKLLLRGSPLAAVDVVLFDKDGTLSRSEPMLLRLAKARIQGCVDQLAKHQPRFTQPQPALADLLARAYGLQPDGIRPCGATAVGSRQHNLISTATALAQVGLGWPESLAIAETVFAATDGLHHGPGVPLAATEAMLPMLGRLRAAGLSLAVISNDSADGIRRFLGDLQIAHLFAAELWSADDRPGKPDPAAVHGLCRRLGTTADRCALIGDANSDLNMARAAGVAVVLGYRSGWTVAPPLDPRYPHLDHWDELDVEPG